MRLVKAANGIWRVHFYDDEGRRRRVSTGSRDKEEARRIARAVMLEALAEAGAAGVGGDAARSSSSFTVEDALEHTLSAVWRRKARKTLINIRSDIRVLCRDLGHMSVGDVTYPVLLDYVRTMEARGYSAGHISKLLGRLRVAFKEIARLPNPKTGVPYLLSVPEFPSVRVEDYRDRVLSEDEERRLLAACKEAAARKPSQRLEWQLFAWFIRWALDTGMRRGEILYVRFEDIKNDIAHLPAHATKTRRARRVPLTSRLIDFVRRFQPVLGCPGPVFGGVITVNRAHTFWRQACEAAGVEGVRIHDLRHTCATRLAEKGTPIEIIADLLGHRKVSMTYERYRHVGADTVARYVRAAESGDFVPQLVKK